MTDKHLEQISKAFEAVSLSLDELSFQLRYVEDKDRKLELSESDLTALDAAIWDLPEAGSTWYRMNSVLFDQLKNLRDRIAMYLHNESKEQSQRTTIA